MLKKLFMLILLALICATGRAQSFDLGVSTKNWDILTSLAAAPSTPKPTLAKPEHIAPPATTPQKVVEREHEMKITGREFDFHDEEGGIPINTQLEVCTYLVNEARADCNLKGFVTEASPGEARLFINMKKMPEKHFLLLIGGISQFIDGEAFRDKSRAFTGRFPGSHGFMRFFKKAVKLAANAVMLTATFGPVAGGAILIGGEIVHLTTSHMQRKAHEEFVRYAAQHLTPQPSTTS